MLALVMTTAGCLGPGASNNQSPKAVLVADDEVNVGTEMNFSANDSFDKDGKIVLYHWDFGDGVIAFGKYVSHSYAKGGNYTVTLTVTDDQGGKGISRLGVHVNELPVASMRIDKTVAKIDEDVELRSIGSYDPDGFIREYYWDFGDGSNATGAKCRHAYRNIGPYIITLTVVDDSGGKASDVKMIEIVLREFNVTWQEDSTSSEHSNTTMEGRSTYVECEAEMFNLTKVTFTLAWNDDIHPIQNENDVFALNVTSPDGETKSVSSIEGLIQISFDLAEIPETFAIFARTPKDARNIIGDAYLSDQGLGTWHVVVTAVDCGDGYSLIGLVRDTKNKWDLTVTYTFYEMEPVEI